MEKILIINGSPRAKKSNSRQYAQLFAAACPGETDYAAITKTNHRQLCQAMEGVSDVLFVFPLYADGIPVTLLNFLKTLEEQPPVGRPRVSVLVNCGFLEPEQNDVAVEMVGLFAKRNGYPLGCTLKIGSGEAILSTPFRFLVRAKIRRLARALARGECREMEVTMPLTKGMFLRASSRYWEGLGRRNGITPAQMAVMDIEGQQDTGV